LPLVDQRQDLLRHLELTTNNSLPCHLQATSQIRHPCRKGPHRPSFIVSPTPTVQRLPSSFHLCPLCLVTLVIVSDPTEVDPGPRENITHRACRPPVEIEVETVYTISIARPSAHPSMVLIRLCLTALATNHPSCSSVRFPMTLVT
jgi:hypothetical protein